jgi:ribulose-phosphate 3-epimerase
MAIIAPAILATTPEEYEAQIGRIHNFAERVHVDVTDGEFAQNLTVPETQVWWPKEWKADVHMMVARPSEHLATIIQMNPNMVIFHAECEEDLAPIFKKLKAETMIKPGVALLRSTVPETCAEAIKEAEHVLIFSGNLGEYGGKASTMQLEKIRLVKAINSNVEIGWDGGANLSNVFSLAQAGVDVINVGGAIATSNDPDYTYKAMVEEANRKGAI